MRPAAWGSSFALCDILRSQTLLSGTPSTNSAPFGPDPPRPSTCLAPHSRDCVEELRTYWGLVCCINLGRSLGPNISEGHTLSYETLLCQTHLSLPTMVAFSAPE